MRMNSFDIYILNTNTIVALHSFHINIFYISGIFKKLRNSTNNLKHVVFLLMFNIAYKAINIDIIVTNTHTLGVRERRLVDEKIRHAVLEHSPSFYVAWCLEHFTI